MIIQGGRFRFLTTSLISFEDKESAEIYEELLIVLVSLSEIPCVNPEMMLNTQYRINERYLYMKTTEGSDSAMLMIFLRSIDFQYRTARIDKT